VYAAGLVAFLMLAFASIEGCDRGDGTLAAFLVAVMLTIILMIFLGTWLYVSRQRLTHRAKIAIVPAALFSVLIFVLGFLYVASIPSGCPA
jgi:hypothetical protein